MLGFVLRDHRGVTSNVPPEMRERIYKLRNKRARRLLELILEHGEVTTEQLSEDFGYQHPPRAKKDAIDLGFPVVARTVSSRDGTRRISAYSLATNATFLEGRGGRRLIPKALRDRLLAAAGGRCASCGARFPDRSLQVDHRIPYEIGGETAVARVGDFQVLCASCNRAKSWTCETECPNWVERDPSVCVTCMWGSPKNYEHIATQPRRQVVLTWDGEETDGYERLRRDAAGVGEDLATYIRRLLRRE